MKIINQLRTSKLTVCVINKCMISQKSPVIKQRWLSVKNAQGVSVRDCKKYNFLSPKIQRVT